MKNHLFIHVSNPWKNSDNVWIEKEYRIVGTMPFLINTKSKREIEVKNTNSFEQFNNIPSLLEKIDEMCLIEFNSGRVNVGYHILNDLNEIKIDINEYVILEADRGMDCGKIISFVDKKEYIKLLDRIDRNLNNQELHPKRIYRIANEDERRILKNKKIKEDAAIIDCRMRVERSNLQMKIEKCEYQWDMNKLTFFFDSECKIDFRELVKDLYKEYKMRIWMCALNKSKNHLLRELVR